MIEPLIILGEFFYNLAHHPLAAILMGLSLMLAGRGHLLVHLLIAAVLIAVLFDALTGHLLEDFR